MATSGENPGPSIGEERMAIDPQPHVRGDDDGSLILYTGKVGPARHARDDGQLRRADSVPRDQPHVRRGRPTVRLRRCGVAGTSPLHGYGSGSLRVACGANKLVPVGG